MSYVARPLLVPYDRLRDQLRRAFGSEDFALGGSGCDRPGGRGGSCEALPPDLYAISRLKGGVARLPGAERDWLYAVYNYVPPSQRGGAVSSDVAKIETAGFRPLSVSLGVAEELWPEFQRIARLERKGLLFRGQQLLRLAMFEYEHISRTGKRQYDNKDFALAMGLAEKSFGPQWVERLGIALDLISERDSRALEALYRSIEAPVSGV